MQQLSGMDASFLYGETPRAHMAGAGLYIYDQSTAPGGRSRSRGSWRTSRAACRRLGSSASGWCVCPFDLDHPYWIEDPAFDLEFHVRHIALPKPGDWRQLCIQVARLISRPLDLDRPLWELYVIEGLDNVDRVPKGSFAAGQQVPPRGDRRHVRRRAQQRHPRPLAGPRADRSGGPSGSPRRSRRRPPAAGPCRAATTLPDRCTSPGSSAARCPGSAGCRTRSVARPSRRRRPRSRGPAGAARSAPTACSTECGSTSRR